MIFSHFERLNTNTEHSGSHAMDLSGVSTPQVFWHGLGRWWGVYGLIWWHDPQFGFGLDFGSTLVFFLNLGVGPGL